MAVPQKILVVFIMSFMFSVVNCPVHTVRDLTLLKNLNVSTVMVDENVVINLLRKRRETTRGHGCPIGKIFYFTGCRTFKELEDDFIIATTQTSPYETTKPTVQEDKYDEETNADFSVAPLVTPNVARKISTVFHESTSTATQQTTVITEPNINVKSLKAVVMPDVETNPIPTKVTVKTSSSLVVTDPKHIVKSSNKESRTGVGTETASVLVINTTTSTPPLVQQQPHVLESTSELSVIPKATFMETKITSSVSHSNIVRELEVQKLKNITELSKDTERVLSKETGRTTFNVEPVSVETKRKHTATQTPLVADSNHVMLQSTTGADEVALGTVDDTSTSAAVDTNSTVPKIIEIKTSTNAEGASESTETNFYPVPQTTPLPTGTSFTEVESDSSTTIVKSGSIPGSHLLDIFFSKFETLAGICAVVLLGIGVVLIIYFICVKYKKSKKSQNDEEAAVERKKKQIVTS